MITQMDIVKFFPPEGQEAFEHWGGGHNTANLLHLDFKLCLYSNLEKRVISSLIIKTKIFTFYNRPNFLNFIEISVYQSTNFKNIRGTDSVFLTLDEHVLPSCIHVRHKQSNNIIYCKLRS